MIEFSEQYSKYVGKWIKETSYGWPRHLFIVEFVTKDVRNKTLRFNVIKIEELDYEDIMDHVFFKYNDSDATFIEPKEEYLQRAIKAIWRKR